MNTLSASSNSPKANNFLQRPGVRLGISVLLVLHVVAVFAAPWSRPRPASALSEWVASFFKPYLEATHQYHGYRFFAPEPGPSHLVRYELSLPDGSVVQGKLPDLAEHWPRLLYHRHFMLTETLNNFHVPYAIASELPEHVQERPSTELFDTYVHSYAQHLMQSYQASSVTLQLIRHEIPMPERVLEGLSLDDERLYRVLYTGTFERESS